MKILYVIHQFLPRHRAGSELYTYYLAKEMQRRGHEVTLFFTEADFERPQYQLRQAEFDGLPFFEASHYREFPTLEHLYVDRAMDTLFEEVLDTVSPDIVHFQHLSTHSLGYIDTARARQIPIVYTLHEYMLMCLSWGLLLRPGLILCDGPEPAACAECARRKYPTSVAEGASKTAVGGRDGRRSTLSRLYSRLRNARPSEQEARAEAIERQLRVTREQLTKVDLFISPSAFLVERFVANGMIAPEKIIHSDNGFELTGFEQSGLKRSTERTRSGLTVGFVGTISEWKGVHVLIEAFSDLDPPEIRCEIHGDVDMMPEYKKRLTQLDGFSKVQLMGGFDHSKIAEVLAKLDVLVVPSVWFENSPLTIHEAFLAGIPVIASNRGGMAELVEDGVNGLLFELGDPQDLRRTILRLAREPGLLEKLRQGIPDLGSIKSIASDAEMMETRYSVIRSGKRVSA